MLQSQCICAVHLRMCSTSGKMSRGVEVASATCFRMRPATSCLSRTCTPAHDHSPQTVMSRRPAVDQHLKVFETTAALQDAGCRIAGHAPPHSG